MDNPHMFDELTNRLNKVKRPDSGIHNSGEFIGDNEKLEISDEQADSGRDSDPAEPADTADGSGATKKGGILNSFKKFFRIRRKSKPVKMKDDDKVISGQYRAVSEPEMNTNSSSSKERSIPRSNTGMEKRYNDSPNVNDLTSDDEETRTDEKKSSLKDAPSFIRSSLRKLKLRKKKTGGMDSTEVTPTAVKKHNVEAPPPVSPKKSPKKIPSSRSSHSSDQTEPRSDSFTRDFNIETDEMYFSGKGNVTESQPIAVNFKEDPQAWQPIIESSAAKDKIRIAPRGRKPPTRFRTQTNTADISDKKSSLAQISEHDVSGKASRIENKNTVLAELSKKTVKDIPKKSSEDISKKHTEYTYDTNRKREVADDEIIASCNGSISIDAKQSKVNEAKNARNTAVDQTFDSFITSLESIGNTVDVSTPKKSSHGSKSSVLTDTTITSLPKLQPKSGKSETKQRSRENIENIHNSRKNSDNVNSSPKSIENTRGSGENFEVTRRSLKSSEKERSLSLSLGDLIIDTADVSPTRRSKSFKISNGTEIGSHHQVLPGIVPLKEDSAENKRYDKHRKHRSQSSPDNMKQNIFSKSVENVSILNKENNRRSGHFNEPLPTPHRKGFSDVNRGNLINDTSLGKSDENVRKSLERLKKSSSRHSLNETTFAITTNKNNQDPVIPYGDSISKELTNPSPDKPRKLQKKAITGSKDDITNKATTKKPRPQSVKVRSTDANVVVSKVSAARSHGDIPSLSNTPDPVKSKPLPPISKKVKPLVNTGKSKSIDKPQLVTTGTIKSVDTQKVSNNNIKSVDSITNGDNNMPEFKRMSLKKTPKTDDYLPKEMVGEVGLVAGDVNDEKHVFTSIKTNLKHVEKTNVDISDTHDTRDDKDQENSGQYTYVENKTNVDKDKQLPSPGIVESKPSPVDSTCLIETREVKDKSPEFHRISLKKVEKRDDYLEKEPESIYSNDVPGDLDQKSEISDNKTNSSEHTGSSHEVKTIIPSPTDEDIMREKPKPPVKSKPFQFQSYDVKGDENKSQSSFDKPKSVPLSQTTKLPYFRKSIDIQENPNPHGVPSWIAMAKERQRDEASEKINNEVPKETSYKTDEVTVENLVKPSALKAKPAPLPKPAAISKPDISSQATTSPPATTKKPPPISQRPSLGRFNAKTDLPKDACMVCGKTAYVLERCEVNKRTLHRSCAKCYVCSRTLNLGDIFISDDKVWCKQHR